MIFPYKDKKPNLCAGVRIMPGAKIIGDVTIGASSSVWFNSVIRGDVNVIQIGENTNIQDLTMVHCTSNRWPCSIGDNVVVGHRAIVHGCTIGNNVLVGMGAIIMDGAVIGDGTIVGAGALVLERKIFPPGVLIAGTPAVVKRNLSEEEILFIKGQADHYSELAKTYPENI
jgi:carbonic anhydrase/acetyltransferase-like protein (isoleucine patch superfamily)